MDDSTSSKLQQISEAAVNLDSQRNKYGSRRRSIGGVFDQDSVQIRSGALGGKEEDKVFALNTNNDVMSVNRARGAEKEFSALDDLNRQGLDTVLVGRELHDVQGEGGRGNKCFRIAWVPGKIESNTNKREFLQALAENSESPALQDSLTKLEAFAQHSEVTDFQALFDPQSTRVLVHDPRGVQEKRGDQASNMDRTLSEWREHAPRPQSRSLLDRASSAFSSVSNVVADARESFYSTFSVGESSGASSSSNQGRIENEQPAPPPFDPSNKWAGYTRRERYHKKND